SGAHHVIVSSATAGRLLGLSSSAPPLLDVVEDLLSPGQGMSLAMRSASRDEVGRSPRALADVVIAVIRRGQVLGLDDARTDKVQSGDQLAYVRHENQPPREQPVSRP
ncbi:MAG TPA: potassium transporter Kef, partial [Pilimelia sp.]|nr:potassium transporter Kef [Pilimelia sp.]